MTLMELKHNLAKEGKTLRYVGQTWQRCYIARDGRVDDDRVVTMCPKRGNYKYYCDCYVDVPSWRSTTYSHRNYYRIIVA